MRSFTSSTQTLLPAFLLLFGAFLMSTIAFAQSKTTKATATKVVVESSTESFLKKTINVEDVNGEIKVTVTTEKGGNKTTKTYKGEAAEEYLENRAERMVEEAFESGFEFKTESGNDTVKVIIKNSGDMDLSGTQVIWIGEDGDDPDFTEIRANSVQVENENGVTIINASVSDQEGEHIEKVVIIEEAKVVESMEDMRKSLEELGLDAQLNIEMVDGKEVKSIMVCSKIVVEDTDEFSELDDLNNSMFKVFGMSANLSDGQIRLDFETLEKGKGTVSVLDINGNILFMDTFNGRSSYSKDIRISNYHGIAILKIEQGDNVEVRKLIIE